MIERCYITFGANVRALRLMKEMTQGELAERVKLSRPSIVQIENGNQRILLHQVVTFAKALGVSASLLAKESV